MESSKKHINIIPDQLTRQNNHHTTIKTINSIPPHAIVSNVNHNKISNTPRSIITKTCISKQSKHQYQLQQKASKNELLSFLKREVSSIIEKEKKVLKNKIVIEKDLQDFRNNPQPIIITPQQKIKSFMQAQRHNLYQKQSQSNLQWEKKDERVKQILQQKKSKHNQKFQKRQEKIQQVRKRHQQKELQALSLVDQLLHQHSRSKSFGNNNYQLKNSKVKVQKENHKLSNYKKCNLANTQNCRLNSTDIYTFKCYSKRQSQFTHQQNKKITNYILRMKKIGNNILQKQLQNQKRKHKGIHTSVRCLVKQRKAMQQKKMQQDEQRYKTKMDSFCQNYSRLKQSSLSLSQNKSFLKEKTKNDVLMKKQQLKQIHNQYLMNEFQKKNSRILQRSKFRNTSRDIIISRMLNSRNKYRQKIQIEKNQHQKIMKIVYEKLQKIKKFKGQQDLSDVEKKQIINLLDPKDPQQKQLIDFFNDSKFNYALKKIYEQQQKIKQIKINKKMQRNKENIC